MVHFCFQHNSSLKSLDLEDNGLDSEGLVPIINVLKNNIYITSLVSIGLRKITFKLPVLQALLSEKQHLYHQSGKHCSPQNNINTASLV